jgi:ELP3 family radical SAM enzyme/protein acetyltransferase
MSLIDIEELGTKHLRVTDAYRGIPEDTLTEYILDITKRLDNSIDKQQWKHILTEYKRKHHINPGTFQLNYHYRKLLENGDIERNIRFELFNSARNVRVDSGVVVASLLMSGTPDGQVFTCAHDCYFCPDEKPSEENNWTQQPRSYLMKEPAVLRANRNDFDTVFQIHDRLSTISLNGHNVDKVEVIALGGTFSCYPEEYQERFSRDIYYAANTFFDNRDTPRERLSIEEEILLNETARVRIIGYTIEDRPDYCNNADVFQRYRRFGVTRIQIGIQHINQKLLDKVNRGCTQHDAEIAVQNAKDNCFKIDGHWMPDLPGATPEMDWEMFKTVIYGDTLQLDQWKIYPCETVEHTEIKRWFQLGKYEHYSEEELIKLIMKVKKNVPPWIRLNRVIRDIPTNYHIAGVEKPNLRQIIQHKMAKLGWKCRCIRCREPKNKDFANKGIEDAVIMIREYSSSGGTEYFISMEHRELDIIYGFCRLRLSEKSGIVCAVKKNKLGGKRIIHSEHQVAFPELLDCALIRELHVYGTMNVVSENQQKTQHRGIGKALLKKAEEIALTNGYVKAAVISGVGVRGYYRKRGYELENTFMIKYLKKIADIHPKQEEMEWMGWFKSFIV